MNGILAPKRFVWSQIRCDVLKELWATGMSTRRIGQQMKISHNAVIGKARRLKLPPRRSPVPNHQPTGITNDIS